MEPSRSNYRMALSLIGIQLAKRFPRSLERRQPVTSRGRWRSHAFWRSAISFGNHL